jgi:2-phosphosulfolactate phosphatase
VERVHVEWGPQGAARAAAGGLLVVVDVLSFTTSVSVCADRGTVAYPAAFSDEHDERARELAEREGAVLAAGRRAATPEHPWSLSPAALRAAPAPARLVLPSPNGSAIAAAAPPRVTVVAACLRNAPAVGRWAAAQRGPVTVVPAGERWPDDSLRPALEDLLGAGAVVAALVAAAPGLPLSPEADAARATWLATLDPADAVRACASGQELVLGGFAGDVEIAVEIGTSDVVPVLTGGAFRPAR